MRDFEWEGKRRRYRKKVILLDKAKEQYNNKITNKTIRIMDNQRKFEVALAVLNGFVSGNIKCLTTDYIVNKSLDIAENFIREWDRRNNNPSSQSEVNIEDTSL